MFYLSFIHILETIADSQVKEFFEKSNFSQKKLILKILPTNFCRFVFGKS